MFSTTQLIHTSLPEKYSCTCSVYKRVRDEIGVLIKVVKGLSSYEFGGSFLKNFTNISNTISSTTNIKMLKRDDIYTDAAFLGYELSQTMTDKHLKEVCTDFSSAYENIAKEKRKMNGLLKDVLEELTILKKTCKQIDHQRKVIKNTRIELEKKLQSNIYKEDEKVELENRLDTLCTKVTKEMEDFMALNIVQGIVIKIGNIHKDFCLKSGEYLSKF